MFVKVGKGHRKDLGLTLADWISEESRRPQKTPFRRPVTFDNIFPERGILGHRSTGLLVFPSFFDLQQGGAPYLANLVYTNI